MNTLIIYASIHHNNTKRVAEAIGEVLDSDPVSFSNIEKEDIKKADLVGFGSGIYFRKFHKELIKLAKDLPKIKNKKAFLFSTSGIKADIPFHRPHAHFKSILEGKGFNIVGEFNCPGYDTFGFLKYIGGIHKERPNKKDVENAKDFGKKVLEKTQ